MEAPVFKLLVPSGYAPLCRIEGGSTFEGSWFAPSLRQPFKCWRSTLPPSIKDLVFWFGELPPYKSVVVYNFYHLGEFFVVSDSVRSFLESRANCAFQIERIQTRHPKGEATEDYWAMKVATTIDCIEPEKSIATDSSGETVLYRAFSELATEIPLSIDHAPSFATKEPNTYFAYPDKGAQSVSIDTSSIPSGTKLFQPKYWPQNLIVEEAFARELLKFLTGDPFWVLPMSDISRSWSQLKFSLR